MKKKYLIQTLILLLTIHYCSIAQSKLSYRKSKIAEVHSKDLLLILDSVIDFEHNKCEYYNDSVMYIITIEQSKKNQKLKIESTENCFFDSLCSSFIYKNHIVQFNTKNLIFDLQFYSVSNYWMFYYINIEDYKALIDEQDDSRSIFIYCYKDGKFYRENWYACASPHKENSSSDDDE